MLSLIGSIRYNTGASFAKISKVINDVTRYSFSQTAIFRGYEKLCDSLEPVANKIATDVMNSDSIQIDETSHKLVEESKGSKN